MNEMAPHIRKQLELREAEHQRISNQAWDEIEQYYDEHPEKKKPNYLYHRYDPDYWRVKPGWKSFLRTLVYFFTGIDIFPNLWEEQHPQ